MISNKRILVIGNGFDLSCGLKSRYSDFFKQRFTDLFGDQTYYHTEQSYLNSGNSVNVSTGQKGDYFKLNKDRWPEDITRWDCIFLFAEKFLDNKENGQWQNIENIIFNVVSIVLWPKNEEKLFQSNLHFKRSYGNELSNKAQFVQMVNSFSGAKTDSLEQKANNLLHDLNKFEKIFADYIVKQIVKESGYRGQASELLKTLANWYSEKDNQLDVISFNYSLDARFGQMMIDDGFALNSWTNIHGVASYNNKDAEHYINSIHGTRLKKLPSPIFGIDNHDILEDSFDNDLRLLFTKSYRLVNSEIHSQISSSICSDCDAIIFYGHSLGRADYSYFETLFDDSNLYHSKTRLIFYYFEGDTPLENRERYTSNVVSLLTNYGQTLSNIHGENIVNKLVLEHRLEVLPYPKY
ncbi:AbiH family protein [Limosilactobacillus reuteri]|uniref:AbiH family protein n=1 Tax=Limosilactobacillus reuteri TaxID=1598 RepID=UPI0013004FAE|nr:AbiH family protein [Limosilactobacillus reuteri]WLC95321.1 bacteriophage abortive infection AbiH family protein [Limosilactobacillus reuteri]WRH77468.1 AbiH family protein [Limosilactobacillus reuteri]